LTGVVTCVTNFFNVYFYPIPRSEVKMQVHFSAYQDYDYEGFHSLMKKSTLSGHISNLSRNWTLNLQSTVLLLYHRPLSYP